ncbi:helix-turn-helix domain-containing protein [Apilactobacillus timberlakei]|uniref:helix-turn-helix domain-containing protein n=1 Tax=Apilactobacillus timberlakei TaxID=2008380 RepID=UPI00112EBCF6|nr:helix-turn-helix transcriptional regulator [Apilactobacillus timberlakei]TPR16270.1 XRE family transcriptional regulator [Apilactobacillus timberlakei]TPR21559.1 XRE family transcriptional regulator [Apilactobacillus timberlakei]
MRSSNEIIKLIDKLAAKKGLSQAELSRRTNVSRAAISRYSNGSRKFPLNKSYIFADVLGVSNEYLLGISKNRNNESAVLFSELNEEDQKRVITFMKNLKMSEKE